MNQSELLLQGATEIQAVLSQVPSDRHNLDLENLTLDAEHAVDLDTVCMALGVLARKAATPEDRAFADELGANYLSMKYPSPTESIDVTVLPVSDPVITAVA